MTAEARRLLSIEPPETVAALEISDAELVVATLEGQAWAKEALFRRHLRLAYGLAFRLLGTQEDLSDVVQESMTHALESLARLRDPALFSTWLGRVVINTVRRTLRKRRLLGRLGLRSDSGVHYDSLASSSAPPDVAIEIEMLYRVLHNLPDKQRIALVLRRVEALSLPEIANQMDASLSSVKRWVQAGEAAFDRAVQASRGLP